jgi:hypothetical protein
LSGTKHSKQSIILKHFSLLGTFIDIRDKPPLTETELDSIEKTDTLTNENSPVSEDVQRNSQNREQRKNKKI